MNLPDYFISCDWGTSNFRLRKVESGSVSVVETHQTDTGIKKCNENFLSQNSANRSRFFTDYLMEELEKLEWSHESNKIVVASGMISSSIGMVELEYAKMPLSFDGKGIHSQIYPLNKHDKLIIISGARTDSEVMRGEETQAMGLSGLLPQHGEGVLLLPGTHSKHLFFNAGRFENVNTFLTGELFDLLTKKSILQPSVKSVNWRSMYQDSFLMGVKSGIDGKLMASLFSIRAKNLIHKNSAVENYYFLSGLVIGAELSYLQHQNETIYLAASGLLSTLYGYALESFLPLDRIVHFDARLVDKSVLIGQKKILATYVSE